MLFGDKSIFLIDNHPSYIMISNKEQAKKEGMIFLNGEGYQTIDQLEEDVKRSVTFSNIFYNQIKRLCDIVENDSDATIYRFS